MAKLDAGFIARRRVLWPASLHLFCTFENPLFPSKKLPLKSHFHLNRANKYTLINLFKKKKFHSITLLLC